MNKTVVVGRPMVVVRWCSSYPGSFSIGINFVSRWLSGLTGLVVGGGFSAARDEKDGASVGA